jgi:hypothetical protein
VVSIWLSVNPHAQHVGVCTEAHCGCPEGTLGKVASAARSKQSKGYSEACCFDCIPSQNGGCSEGAVANRKKAA